MRRWVFSLSNGRTPRPPGSPASMLTQLPDETDQISISFIQSFSILSQGGGVSPKVADSLELSRREFAGRRAGTGYSAVVMGIRFGGVIPRRAFASAKTAVAKPYHETAPVA